MSDRFAEALAIVTGSHQKKRSWGHRVRTLAPEEIVAQERDRANGWPRKCSRCRKAEPTHEARHHYFASRGGTGRATHTDRRLCDPCAAAFAAKFGAAVESPIRYETTDWHTGLTRIENPLDP